MRKEKEAEQEFETIRLAHDRQERQAKRERKVEGWEKDLALREKSWRKKIFGSNMDLILVRKYWSFPVQTHIVKLKKIDEGQKPDVFSANLLKK